MCSTSSLKQLRPRSSWLTAKLRNALSSCRAAPAAMRRGRWHPVLQISSGWAPGGSYATSRLCMALNTLMSESRRVLTQKFLKLVPYCTLDKAAWRFWLLSSLRAHSAPFASSPLHRISTSAARLTGAANPRRRRPNTRIAELPTKRRHGGHARGLPREPADQGLCV